jgi:hypothetical protein
MPFWRPIKMKIIKLTYVFISIDFLIILVPDESLSFSNLGPLAELEFLFLKNVP